MCGGVHSRSHDRTLRRQMFLGHVRLMLLYHTAGGSRKVSLQPEGFFDLGLIDAAIEADPSVRLLHVQRSCGYQWRPSLPIQEIER